VHSAGTAVILCGGESRRAGFDKQLIPCGETILPIAIARSLEALFPEIIVVTRTPHLYAATGCMAVPDMVEGAGPLGGIFTGLRHATSDYAYVIAGDMPWRNPAYIEWMSSLLDCGDADAVAARAGGVHLEPFNSFFAVKCAPRIAAALGRGERSISGFLRGCDRAVFVAEDDARRFSPDWSMFRSLNTAAEIEQYVRAQACTAAGHAGMISTQ
jgi:molybdopterin-guanine dinucleotide biosynthesis protein A